MRIGQRSIPWLFLLVLIVGQSAFGMVPAWTDQGLQWPEAIDLSNQSYSPDKRSLSDVYLPSSTPLLKVLVSFADQPLTTTKQQWQERLFDSQISLAAYFDWVSGGAFQLQDAGTLSIELSSLHPDSGADFSTARQLADEVLVAASQQLDLADFDQNTDGLLQRTELAVVLIIAGYEQAFGGADAPHPNIWAHQASELVLENGISFGGYAMFGEWHDNQMASIGIIAHELGHLLFNLPDLYDPDGSSEGIGSWGLMGRGAWNQQFGQAGDSPAALMAWSKEQAGLAQAKSWRVGEPLQLQAGEFIAVTANGVETFYVEQRSRQSFDAALPGEGLLISHLDRTVSTNSNETHKLLDIEEADGLQQLDFGLNAGDAGDTFPGIYRVGNFDTRSAPSSVDYHGAETGVSVQVISDSQLVIGVESTTETSSSTSISVGMSGSASLGLMVLFVPLLWLLRQRRIALR